MKKALENGSVVVTRKMKALGRSVKRLRATRHTCLAGLLERLDLLTIHLFSISQRFTLRTGEMVGR